MPFLKDTTIAYVENIYLNGVGLGKWMRDYNPVLNSVQTENSGRKTEAAELVVEDIAVKIGSMDIELYRMSRADYSTIMEILHQRDVNVKFFAGVWYEQVMNVGSTIKSHTQADGNDKWDISFSLSAKKGES